MEQESDVLADNDLVELLCAHEALRRLGYAPDEIFVELGPEVGGGVQVFVVLRTTNGDVPYRIGPRQTTYATVAFEAVWPRAVAAWNTLPEARALTLWQGSYIRNHAVALVTNMSLRGYPPRRPRPDLN